MKKFLGRFFAWYPHENRRHRQTIEKLKILNEITNGPQDYVIFKAAKEKMLELIKGMD